MQAEMNEKMLPEIFPNSNKAMIVKAERFGWSVFSFIAFVCMIILLDRARIFDSWHYNELEVTVVTLQLDQKVTRRGQMKTKETQNTKRSQTEST